MEPFPTLNQHPAKACGCLLSSSHYKDKTVGGGGGTGGSLYPLKIDGEEETGLVLCISYTRQQENFNWSSRRKVRSPLGYQDASFANENVDFLIRFIPFVGPTQIEEKKFVLSASSTSSLLRFYTVNKREGPPCLLVW